MKFGKKGAKATAKRTGDINSFVFYSSFRDAYEAAKTIGKDRDYMDALLSFAFDGKTTRTGDPILDAFISAFEPQIKANLKRRKDGAKGGAPKGNKNAKKQPMVDFEETQKQPNVNVNVNDNVNVNANVNGNGNVNDNANANVHRTPPIDPFYTEWAERKKEGKQ